jgi:uncharacterized Ntn-hydrolase superfamily protein
MTFSLIGRCSRSGQIGAAVATSSIAVGARCTYAEAGIGAVLTQHRTDPRLGPRGLSLLRSGCTARQTLDALVSPLGRLRARTPLMRMLRLWSTMLLA